MYVYIYIHMFMYFFFNLHNISMYAYIHMYYHRKAVNPEFPAILLGRFSLTLSLIDPLLVQENCWYGGFGFRLSGFRVLVWGFRV